MDRFSFFFGFYGLILGLAVTELLKGFGALVRAGRVRRLGWQTGLLALFALLVICATWIDAWNSLRDTSLDFAGLWAPVSVAVLYYLVAVVTFPDEPAEWSSLDDYYVQRKRFVLSLMLGAEFLVNYTYRSVLLDSLYNHPRAFWWWQLPYNLAIKIGFVWLIFAKGRRANIVGLAVMVLLFLIPYWHRA